jgi:hypothetical protein
MTGRAGQRSHAKDSTTMGRPVTFDTVREIGLALPGAEDGTTYGTPALKVGGRMFACIASNPSAEPDSLVVYVHPDQRDDLIREEPTVFYLKDHYVNYPVVLVRLRRVHRDALKDLLLGSWAIVSSKHPRRTHTKPKPPSRRPRR